MRSAEELRRRLVDEAGEDEVERAASVSIAQAQKELAAAGFDVAAERARAEALRPLSDAVRLARCAAVDEAVRTLADHAGHW